MRLSIDLVEKRPTENLNWCLGTLEEWWVQIGARRLYCCCVQYPLASEQALVLLFVAAAPTVASRFRIYVSALGVSRTLVSSSLAVGTN